MVRLLFGLILVYLAGCVAPLKIHQPLAQSLEAVVYIKTTHETSMSSGAGVIISKNGHILTAAHLISSTSQSVVSLYNSSTFTAINIYIDYERDLALLHISTMTSAFISLASTNSLIVGQHLLVIGHPFGLDWSLAHGIISALRRYPRNNLTVMWIQTDALINIGNSGGPVLNLNNELVGIVSHKIIRRGSLVNTGGNMVISIKEIYTFLSMFKGLP